MFSRSISIHILTLIILATPCFMQNSTFADDIQTRKIVPPGSGKICSLSVDEESKTFVAARHDANGGTCSLYNLAGKLLGQISSTGQFAFANVGISKARGCIISSTWNTIQVHSITDLKVVSECEFSTNISSMAVSPNGLDILIGTDEKNTTEGLVYEYNAKNKKWISIYDAKLINKDINPSPDVIDLKFSSDGAMLAILTKTAVFIMNWNKRSIVKIITPENPDILFGASSFTSDSKKLVVSDSGGDFRVYDTISWECKGGICSIPDGGKLFCISSNTKYFFTAVDTPVGQSSGAWALYTFPKLDQIRKFQSHNDSISTMNLSPDGKTLLVGGRDGLVTLQDSISIEKNK